MGLLGIRNVIITPPRLGHISDFAPRALTIELPRKASNNISRMRECLDELSPLETMPSFDQNDLTFYKLVSEITDDRAKELGLKRYEGIQPFEQLPIGVNDTLGIGSEPLYHTYWNGYNSSEGAFFGDVLRRIDNPFVDDTAD